MLRHLPFRKLHSRDLRTPKTAETVSDFSPGARAANWLRLRFSFLRGCASTNLSALATAPILV